MRKLFDAIGQNRDAIDGLVGICLSALLLSSTLFMLVLSVGLIASCVS